MKIKPLASVLSITLFAASSAHAATYSVQEVNTADKGLNAFAGPINNVGSVAATVQLPLRPPLDLSLIDFESEAILEALTDPDGAQAGNLNDEDYVTLYNFIQTAASDNNNAVLVQAIADVQAYVYENDTLNFVAGFDVIDEELDGYTTSVDTRILGMNDDGVLVGGSTAPYYKIPHTFDDGTETTFVVRDHATRAFVRINDSVTELVAPDSTLGGFSEAYDINSSLQVAGFATTGHSSGLDSSVANCQDENTRLDALAEVCFQRVQNNMSSSFQQRAMIWQLDSAGTVVEAKKLGLLFTPEETDTILYSSRANAINEAGLAVGIANQPFTNNDNIGSFAAVFDGDDVFPITDQEEFFSSEATDVNNNDIVVGFGQKVISGSVRSKFFVHDYRAGTTEFPTDFFSSSSSIARAINDNGIVVGDGEIETKLIGVRRRAGFMYDTNTGEFINLNDLLSCDSPYNIIQANGINNDNEISATALVSAQVIDIAGNVVLDDDGNPTSIERAIVVKLSPVQGGEIDDCGDDDVKLERQGGGMPMWTLILLLPIGLRRLFRG